LPSAKEKNWKSRKKELRAFILTLFFLRGTNAGFYSPAIQQCFTATTLSINEFLGTVFSLLAEMGGVIMINP